MSKKVIDVSVNQGTIDWAKVRTQIDGAILKIGYRGYETGKIIMADNFKANADACKKHSIPFGVYFMTQSINQSEAEEEAAWIAANLKDYILQMPVYIDSELSNNVGDVGRADNLTAAQRTAVVAAFCDKVKALGHVPGIYASAAWYRERLTQSELKDKGYNIWVASYGSNDGKVPDKKPDITLAYDGWQYTSVGKIDGITKDVDLSMFDDASIAKPEPEAPKKQDTVYTVKSGDTLSGIASRYGTTYQVLAAYNNIANPNVIFTGQRIKIPAANAPAKKPDTVYTVKSGDTLSGIASKYKTTYQALAKYNGITDPDKIYAGQKIKIPQ